MSEGDLDKSDPASPYKLQKAREKGNVAKSQEATFVAILFAMTCLVFGMGDRLTRDVSRVLHATLAQVSREGLDIGSVQQLLGTVAMELALVLAAPIAVIVVLAICMGIWQVGFTLSTEPLKPDFNRINPATGFKKLFSMRSIFELIRSSIKLGLVSVLILVAGGAILRELVVLPMRDTSAILAYLIHKVGVILALLTALFVLLALADVAYTRWEFLKQMRMSKREIKDEHKQREGDPRIKSRIRELRMELFKKGMTMQRVKDADVLVTNPTHFAVAIAYKRDTMPAPRILAKGSGDMALKMREMARRHHVMVVENAPLARALYKLSQPDDFLPEQHYAEVAKILVWVFAARKANPTPSPAGAGARR